MEAKYLVKYVDETVDRSVMEYVIMLEYARVNLVKHMILMEYVIVLEYARVSLVKHTEEF